MSVATPVIHKRVLVLNKSWTAVNVCPLHRAITLVWKDYAKIIDPFEQFQTYTWEDWARIRPKSGEDFIQGIRDNFRIPEVILLNGYDRVIRGRGPKFSRREIYRRDKYICQYCAKPVGSEGSIDHVVPRSQGGETSWENCVLSCLKCNLRKDNRTPKQAHMKLLSKPVKPKIIPFKTDHREFPKSWEAFLSEAYWNVEMSHDMP